MVVELNDVETRRPHPGFIFLADAKEILAAPIALNLNYLSDLARLPGRQATLFYQSLTGDAPVRKSFAPEKYAGPNLDLTEIIIALDGRIKSRRVTHSRSYMEALKERRNEKLSPTHLLPSQFHSLEYRFARQYLQKIEKLAQDNVAYAYLPAYGAPHNFHLRLGKN